ncbi:hypothetical protein ACFLZW_07650, partial [Chloroflexota bacterium]
TITGYIRLSIQLIGPSYWHDILMLRTRNSNNKITFANALVTQSKFNRQYKSMQIAPPIQ